MNFELSEDQRAVLDAVDRLAERHGATPAVPERYQYSVQLERDLEAAGFFDCMTIEELGTVTACASVMAVARLPLCAETAASSLIAPWLCPDLPRPFALLWERDDAPTRYLPVARTVIRVRGTCVDVAAIATDDVKAIDSIFAYPMGALRSASSLAWKALPDADATRTRNLWRIGLAAEITGCLDAALASVLEHVKDRRQFGRALGSFQAVQHRLAECTTLVQGAKWLTLKAASTGTALDAALAAGRAQDIATKVSYDLHQFMGAMGLTLEHPLHRWTYRVKLLRADLGGADSQLIAAAEAAWPETPHTATEGIAS
jgi:alkylation response protein AidB-like acyl-CoA dehydrogenase